MEVAALYEVRVRPGKNRIYFTMRGTITADEARAAADEVIKHVASLRPGFDTISDIAGLEPLSPEALEHIRRANAALVSISAGRTIRVVGRSAQAAVQFERLSKEKGYSAQLAFSLQEAERILDGMPDDLPV